MRGNYPDCIFASIFICSRYVSKVEIKFANEHRLLIHRYSLDYVYEFIVDVWLLLFDKTRDLLVIYQF